MVSKSPTMMTSSNGNIFRVTGHLCGDSPANGEFPNKGQWRGALMFSLICVWINDWVNNRKAGDLIRYRLHYDVIVMQSPLQLSMACSSTMVLREEHINGSMRNCCISRALAMEMLQLCTKPWIYHIQYWHKTLQNLHSLWGISMKNNHYDAFTNSLKFSNVHAN